MSTPATWVLASANKGKAAEMHTMLAGHDITLVSMAEFDVASPAEQAITFVENALTKARTVAKATGRPALADDSGLCVDALGGAPGIYSARYAGVHGDDDANNERLLNELAHVSESERTAAFHATIVVCQSENDPAPLIAQGVWRGHIATTARGDHGFGYDPLFIDRQSGLGAAEMTPELKNQRSHRSRACRRLLELLDD
ncbi:RdgB/HAM1 family non-canonical purine NTP pyrophosphatase [Salinisphaera sp. USBA-960]|uniref:RdgB/HAM1 family non-canonical purine NTP pyrophosphatase n=1 Tax=Salinisphaera orenii TaxID=856731 RepID=UPI000DBE2313|nr:RdgB/HAM1 family non-canonical purine NTP pyrophosphatase [Salifodinibacter halophilus]NNC26815.1 RdgB/HAM1 family non-canonical purine NTP pyrophosphatase [Salifodinibacter halophilus]